AEVRDTQKDEEKLSRLNQQDAISLEVIKQSDANAVEVSKQVIAAVDQLEKDYQKEEVSLKIANDSSEFTLTAANNVIFDVFLAVFLVAVVMLLFLHSLRDALIVMVSIPVWLI